MSNEKANKNSFLYSELQIKMVLQVMQSSLISVTNSNSNEPINTYEKIIQ